MKVDKSIEDILLHLEPAIQSKNDGTTDLKARVKYLEAKSYEFERYISKDTMIIFKNCRLITRTAY